MLAATALLVGTQAFAPALSRLTPAQARASTVGPARASTVISLERIRSDLSSDDWQPLQTAPAWRNPCLLTSLITAVSVQQSAVAGVWPLFGLGPLLVPQHVEVISATVFSVPPCFLVPQLTTLIS